MAGNRKTRDEAARATGTSAQAIRASAQRIWLAGLGAFEHARAPRGRAVFDALVAQGPHAGRARRRRAADEALRSLMELNGNLRELAKRAASSAVQRRAGARRTRPLERAQGSGRAEGQGTRHHEAQGPAPGIEAQGGHEARRQATRLKRRR